MSPKSAKRTIEPPSIAQVAEWMRDRSWLDMRCPDGRAQRVLVIGLQITYEKDNVVLEQKWFGDDERLKSRVFIYDLEECWDCRPTTVDLIDVVPLKGRAAVERQEPETRNRISDADRDLIDAVLDAMCQKFTYLTRTLLLSKDQYGGNQYVTHHRHQTIIVLYEMTDLSPRAICTKVFNYSSQQPWVTARYMCSEREGARGEGARMVIREVAAAVDKMTTTKRRRTCGFPPEYSPVLEAAA